MAVTTEPRILSPAMKMADLMDLRPSLPGVLARMGIPFGFGEQTVDEVCRKQDVDPETFLLICSVYAVDGYAPTKERLRKADLRDVLKYLRLSHTYYMDVALNELADALKTLTEPCGEKHKRIIRQFFSEYKDELTKHFEYEEKAVFPYAEAILHHGRLTDDDYEENHSHMEEKLADLKSLLMKYLPPECGQQDICRALSCIYSLQEDVARHIRVEDGVLVPIVNRKRHADLEGSEEPPRSEGESLSAREKEILVCVAKGMLNKEIADAENISIHTVITHRKNITRKTGIKTTPGLTVYAILNNLIDINTFE
jgi:regulator of cell morphogenesis and NO signaling